MLRKLIQASTVKKIVISERMKVCEVSFEFSVDNAPVYNYFSNIMQFVPARDKIKITLQDESDRIFDFSNENEENYNAFIIDTLTDEIINVRICIDKEVAENRFSIYCFDEFSKDILSLSIDDVMVSFSNLLKQAKSFLIFDIYSKVAMFATKTMFFVPHDNVRIRAEADFNRLQRIENCKEVSYFYNFDTYEVLPDDFKVTIDYEDNPLTDLFQKITAVLSISFISNSTTINSSQIKGIINGQRTMEYCCEIENLSNDKILYIIYNWIYTDGNTIDKAIIARNVISLHCKYTPISEIDDSIMASIQSNYNLYLKDNVKEYLELKNEVAKFISSTVSKTGEYATGLLDKFKSNIIAIFGFIFTVILANIVSEQPLDNLFTSDITTLVECVLVGSFIYLIICYCQSHYEIQKVYDSYNQLKQYYGDILTLDDLQEIFRNDEILHKMKNTITRTEKIYLVAWILFLLVAFIVIENISSAPNIQCFIDYIEKIDLMKIG